jgi:hypothetical protein
MGRKATIEAGRDASVDQSVTKGEAPRVGIVQGIFDDKGKLAITAMALVMVSELVLYGILAIAHCNVPSFFEALVLGTLTTLAGVCGAQRINGRSK